MRATPKYPEVGKVALRLVTANKTKDGSRSHDMWLHTQVATGSFDHKGKKINFSVDSNLPDGSLVVNVNFGKDIFKYRYIVSMREVLEATLDAFKSGKNK